MTINCATCEKSFESYPSLKQKYCSRACADIGRRKRKINCAQCGREFRPRNEHSKYCSRACDKLGRGRQITICAQCGKKFFSYPSEHAKYCSHACANFRSRAPEDLTGKIFGKWTVLGRSDRKHSSGWRCRCECGAIRCVRGDYLLKGLSTQCNDCARGYTNLVGRVFGKWTVIDRVERGDTGGTNNIWLCRCECGAEQKLGTFRLTSGLTKGCKKCAVIPGPRIRPYEALFNKLRGSAIREHKLFALTYEEFLTFTDIPACHYCGASVRFVKHGHGRKSGRPYNLDRKANDLGYRADNLVVCCDRCNRAKGNRFTYEEWYAMTACFRKEATAA
jgi:hypothetical protein